MTRGEIVLVLVSCWQGSFISVWDTGIISSVQRAVQKNEHVNDSGEVITGRSTCQKIIASEKQLLTEKLEIPLWKGHGAQRTYSQLETTFKVAKKGNAA